MLSRDATTMAALGASVAAIVMQLIRRYEPLLSPVVALKATANCLLPLELRDEGSAGRPRWRVLAKGHPHWKAHVARRTFDADLDQRTAVKVRLHHVQGHVSPSQAGLEKGVLGSEIRKAPGQRRQHAEISALR